MNKEFTITNFPNDELYFRNTLFSMAEELRSDTVDDFYFSLKDLATVIGTNGSLQSISTKPHMPINSVSDKACQYLTVIIYELLGYFAPHVHYTNMITNNSDITTIRVIDLDITSNGSYSSSTFAAPLYAMNLFPIKSHGYWKDIGINKPSAIAPTFELLGIEQGQTISLGNEKIMLDELNFQKISVYEATRLGSIAELVFSKETPKNLNGDYLINQINNLANEYRKDQTKFLAKLKLGRAMFGIALATTIIGKGIDLIIGNYAIGTVDQFVTMLVGKHIEQSPIQQLKTACFHTNSPSYLDFKPYFEKHDVHPFCIDAKNLQICCCIITESSYAQIVLVRRVKINPYLPPHVEGHRP